MNKIVEVRSAIQSFLKTLHPRVSFEEAPDNAVYPYLVFDLPNSNDDGSMEQFILEVDGWDAPVNGDTTALETMMSALDGDGDRVVPTGLHRKTIMVLGALSLTFYRENRMTLKDDDKRLRRRKYIYQVRTHGTD